MAVAYVMTDGKSQGQWGGGFSGFIKRIGSSAISAHAVALVFIHLSVAVENVRANV